MSSKNASHCSVYHPPVGTRIGDNSIELVEVLGVGGYGVVYRGVDLRSSSRRSYAVKCLIYQGAHAHRHRQVHLREISLHQRASAHPNVVSLHRVIEADNMTFIVMDYAPDHDLFTQILHSCLYLGDDQLIKSVFLQILDAVEYCHSQGIYHRDLKPENVLCFNDGLRVAITDFGLATVEQLSDEFRTGSVYHMSPECQGGDFAPTGHYSPMFNDIWSLGIILLNLSTGRNPWKAATADDGTFQNYLRTPHNFLPTVLPISAEANRILRRMLEVDWRKRATIPEIREAIKKVSSFYCDGVIFEGSMARCPWEEEMDVDESGSSSEEEDLVPTPPKSDDPTTKPSWSRESSVGIIIASESRQYNDHADESYLEHSAKPSPSTMDTYDPSYAYYAPSGIQTPSDSQNSSFLATPGKPLMTFATKQSDAAAAYKQGLTIDTNYNTLHIYNPDDNIVPYSPDSAMIESAFERPDSAAIFASPAFIRPASSVMPGTYFENFMSEDKEMMSTPMWTNSPIYSPPIYSPASSEESYLSRTMSFERSRATSPDLSWSSEFIRVENENENEVESSKSHPSQLLPSSVFTLMTDICPPTITPITAAALPPLPAPVPPVPALTNFSTSRRADTLQRTAKTKHTRAFKPFTKRKNFLAPIRTFFARSSSPASSAPAQTSRAGQQRYPPPRPQGQAAKPASRGQTPSTPTFEAWFNIWFNSSPVSPGTTTNNNSSNSNSNYNSATTTAAPAPIQGTHHGCGVTEGSTAPTANDIIHGSGSNGYNSDRRSSWLSTGKLLLQPWVWA